MATRPARSDGALRLRQGATPPTSAGTHLVAPVRAQGGGGRQLPGPHPLPGRPARLRPGLNVVVLTLRIRPPWGGEPLGCPINIRLFRKGGATPQRARRRDAGGGRRVAARAPLRALRRRRLRRTRCCRASEDPGRLPDAPQRRRLRARSAEAKGKRGRPRKKGQRLPSLSQLAAQATWERVELELRGRKATRLLYARPGSLVPDVSDPPGAARDRARPRAPGRKTITSSPWTCPPPPA